MKAIISDIHGNLEALQAVLDDISRQKIDDGIYCLGDVIGYGPNPRECIDLVMDCKLVLLGNHDQGRLCSIPTASNPAARARDYVDPRPAGASRPKRVLHGRSALGVPGRPTAVVHRENGNALRSRLRPQPDQRIRLP